MQQWQRGLLLGGSGGNDGGVRYSSEFVTADGYCGQLVVVAFFRLDPSGLSRVDRHVDADLTASQLHANSFNQFPHSGSASGVNSSDNVFYASNYFLSSAV